MPRQHTGQPGARQYNDTPTTNLEDAIDAVENDSISIYKASLTYGMPYRTLYNKIKGLHSNPADHPSHMPLSVEEDIVNIIEFCASMRASIDGADLKSVVQNMLNTAGINHLVFKDNLPGRDWLNSFLKRHMLSQRIADNVKRIRAEINGDFINEYILQMSLERIHPQIFLT